MPKRYAKYGLFLLSHDYQVVWATMMGNECFMVCMYIYIYEQETSVCMDCIVTIKQETQSLFDVFSHSFNT